MSAPLSNPVAAGGGRGQNLGTRLLDESDAAQAAPSSGANGGQVDAVQGQLNRVIDVMHDNVSTMVNNLEKGSNLEARSADLASQATQFQRTSRQARRHMWWQQCKMKLIIGGGCSLALLIIILIICGQMGAFDGHGAEASPPPPSPGPLPPPPPSLPVWNS